MKQQTHVKQQTQAVPNVLLRRQREKRHWTQTELARMLGATYVSVCRWENGATSPSLYYRKKLCEIFEVTSEELGLTSSSEKEMGSEKEASEDAALAAQEAVWNVPYRRNPFFTGRERILARLQTLLGSKRAAALSQAHAISGLGGIGKTQTAIEYAYRHQHDYAAIFWASAETREDLEAALVNIAGLLGLEEQREQDQSRIIAAVKRWLSTNHSWLLILDNVEDMLIVEDIVPYQAQGHILLTTRAQSTGTFAQRLDLERMEPEEGALFLLRCAKLIRPDAPLEAAAGAELAVQICQQLEGLPLALDQAGAYIEETGCSLSDYQQHYQAQRTILLNRRGRQRREHPESVGATFTLSFQKVEHSNAAAAELLRLCAFLAPDAIPQEVITEGATVLVPGLSPLATNPFALDEALAILRKYTLLRRNPESKLLTVHRLVQAVLKDAMNEQLQREWVERCVRAVNLIFPEGEFANWQQCERVLPQVSVCAMLIEQWKIDSAEAAALLQRAGNYLQQRGQYHNAERLLKQGLALYEQMPDIEPLTLATSLNELAVLYWLQGRYDEAEELFQRSLDMREEALGPDHHDVAGSLNDLAVIYKFQGKYALAEPLYLRALSIRERALGLDHQETVLSLHNLGVHYLFLGRYAQAEELLRQALTSFQQTLRPDHPLLAHALHDLAYLYYAQGRYAEAEPLFLQGRAIREQAYGPEHWEVGISLNDLATVYRDQGRYGEARELFASALEIYEKAFGPEHFHVAQNLNQYGLLYKAQGDFSEAERLLLRSLTIREQTLKSDHPHIALSLVALGEVYLAQGRYTEAEPLLERAVAICEAQLGPEHPDAALCLYMMGMLCFEQGKLAEAEPFLARARGIQERALGGEHPQTIATRELHGRLLRVLSAEGE